MPRDREKYRAYMREYMRRKRAEDDAENTWNAQAGATRGELRRGYERVTIHRFYKYKYKD